MSLPVVAQPAEPAGGELGPRRGEAYTAPMPRSFAVIILLSLTLVVVLTMVPTPLVTSGLILLAAAALHLRLLPTPLRTRGRKLVAPAALAHGPPRP